MFEEYEKRMLLPDWKISTEDKKEGLTIWQRTTPEGLNAMKAQAIVNRTPRQLMRVIGNDSLRTSYDATFDEGKMIDRIGDQVFIVW